GDLKELPALAELGDDIVDLAERSEFNENPVDDAKVLPLDEEDGESEEQEGRNEERSEHGGISGLEDGGESARRASRQDRETTDPEITGGA
ncbi:MAG: hypothetical protein ACE5D3_05865, partial [Candidatus Binatia bacterium]